MNTAILETHAEIIKALANKQDFDSNYISGKQLPLAYVVSFRGEDWAFLCAHDDLYINLHLSAEHMGKEMAKVQPEDKRRFIDSMIGQVNILREAFPDKKDVDLCTVDRFAIAAAIHDITPDDYIISNMRDRGLMKSFVHMSLKLMIDTIGD